MTENFLDEYPLDYLISNKDKKADAYQELFNTCVYLLDGHKSSEGELEVSWDIFQKFVFIYGLYLLEHKTYWRICNLFVNKFNHSGESFYEFLSWNFSDMINETQEFFSSATSADWEAMNKNPVDISALDSGKR